MKRILSIAVITGLAHFAFAQNFGIDNPSPTEKLDVNGNVKARVYYDADNTGYYINPNGYSNFNQLNISRDGAGECCSGGNYTLSLAESTSGTGRTATIEFHNGGVDEGYLRLANGGFRRIEFGDNQGQKMGIEATGNIMKSNNSQGYLALTGDLPGYPINTYPTLKTDGGYLYISVGGAYSAYISSGGGYTAVSSRSKKENFEELDKQAILSKIGKLEMYRWNYKTEDDKVKHIGPIAQDFYEKFHLGDSDSMITHIDPAGIALVGIQALAENQETLARRVEALEKENAMLKIQCAKAGIQDAEITDLKNQLADLTRTLERNGTITGLEKAEAPVKE